MELSIVIVSWNVKELLEQCIRSIMNTVSNINYEIIIVDNASSDGTKEYLVTIEEQYQNIKVIFNPKNLGFAAANNIGIKNSSGEYIILLNNDTIVTYGWINGLIKYFNMDPLIGMVGPVTNSIGNEARINVDYKNLKDMDNFAYIYTNNNRWKYFEISVLAMFCIALSKNVIEKVGLLDEQYTVGMFEDDDYSLRVKRAGYKIICAEDVFIHHFGGASFNRLDTEEYQKVFEENKRKFENKWNIKWVPHKYREGVK